MKPATFRGRLTLGMSALSLGVLALASLLIYVGIRWALVRNLDEALLALARTEIASAFDEPGGLIHVHDQAPSEIDLDLAYEKVSLILDGRGEVVARTGNLVSGPRLELRPELAERALAGEVVLADASRDGVRYRAIHHPLQDAEGTRYAIVVALSRRPLELTLDAVVGVLAVALVVAGVLAAFASSRLAGRLTRPLERIATAAQEVNEKRLTLRIPEVSSDRELRVLVGLLNDMLARIEAAFVVQRRFVADASHELRSPLSNLRGTIEVALRHPRSATEYREALAVALGEIERLARLVHRLLTLSRADAGRLSLERRPVDLVDLATRAIQGHAARAAALGVELHLDAAAPAIVEGDPDRLREVVDNLLDNALQVAPADSSIEVRVTPEGERCVLGVADSGPGLTEEERARVFEPFARGAAAGPGGAGLGLAIARSVVEAHGGRLDVRSRDGRGALFQVELPSGTAHPSPVEPPTTV